MNWFRSKLRTGVYLWKDDWREFYQRKLSNSLSISSLGDIRHNTIEFNDYNGNSIKVGFWDGSSAMSKSNFDSKSVIIDETFDFVDPDIIQIFDSIVRFPKKDEE